MKNLLSSSGLRLSCTVIAVLFATVGCAKKVTPDAEVKTVAFYVEHQAEREKAAKACGEFMDGPYTALTADERDVARKSPWMTNCSNVGEAILAARGKRQREAASKY